MEQLDFNHRERPKKVSGLKEQAGQDLLVFGSGTLVNALITNELIDEYRLLVYPVVLGNGRAFFQSGTNSKLKLTQTQTFSSGVVALTYING